MRTPAERLDAAVDEVLTGHRPAVSPELDRLVDAASLVRSALAPLPAGTRFEARLALRLARPGPVARIVSGVGDAGRRGLRHPARLLITGALSSALLGIGLTVIALRRGSRRDADAAVRPAHR
ncbi:MAG: hypothetical protein WD116_02890 [Chloroflexota bacterium]